MNPKRANQALNSLLNLRYDAQTLDCGHLVLLAQERLFGRRIEVASAHPRGRLSQAELIRRMCGELGRRVEQPAHGDVALYTQADPASGQRYYHLGQILLLAGERWLLHVRVGGRSVLQREDAAVLQGLQPDGYFRPLEAL